MAEVTTLDKIPKQNGYVSLIRRPSPYSKK